MELDLDNKHESLSLEWQYQLILLLRKTLLSKRVKPKLAKDIIGDFVFDLSMLHDQGTIDLDGKSFNPKICFDDLDGKLIASAEESSLHDYAFGSTSQAFGE